MRLRPLGSTGLRVSEVGFGAWQLGSSEDWGVVDDAAALHLVGEALDRGVTLFDTSPNYASGRSEELLGRALGRRRDEVVLVSKFGRRPDGRKDLSPGAFRPSLEGSLRRLRTDHLDVLLLHNPDPATYRAEHPLWELLEGAREQGRIRYYGASLDFAREIEACLRNTPSEVLEILFNVFHQDVRRAFPLVRARGVGTIVKVPLDSGWLTGKYGGGSRFEGIRSRWMPEDIRRRGELVAALERIVGDGTPLVGKALGFVLAYAEVSSAIPGSRTREQLRSNVACAGHPVTSPERERLEAFWDEITASGERPLPW